MRKIIPIILMICIPSVCFAEYEELTEIKSFAKTRLKEYSLKLSSVDPKYEGVVAVGKSLKKFSETSNIVVYTTHSKDYWRAVLEMAHTDPSILFSTAYMYFLKGEIAYGELYLFLGKIGMDESFRQELNEYRFLQTKLVNKIQEEMQKGIKLHDKEQYEEAIAIYDAIIKEYPSCAWAWYEKGFSYLLLSMKDKRHETRKDKMYKECRIRNPFYWEAYQGSDKQVLAQLPWVLKAFSFLNGDNTGIEGLIGFAEGCREIGLYTLAAHAEWKLVLFDVKNREKHINLFLENLTSLELKEIDFFKSLFK